MRFLFVFLLMLTAIFAQADDQAVVNKGTAPTDGSTLTGKPTFVRSSPRTEVFFRDLKNSYWIDDDHNHNGFMNAFLVGAKKGKSVSFSADPETRKITKVEGINVPLVVVPVETLAKTPDEGGKNDLEKGNKEQKEK